MTKRTCNICGAEVKSSDAEFKETGNLGGLVERCFEFSVMVTQLLFEEPVNDFHVCIHCVRSAVTVALLKGSRPVFTVEDGKPTPETIEKIKEMTKFVEASKLFPEDQHCKVDPFSLPEPYKP